MKDDPPPSAVKGKKPDRPAPLPDGQFAASVLKLLYGKTLDSKLLDEALTGGATVKALKGKATFDKSRLKQVGEAVIGDPPDVFGTPFFADKKKGAERVKSTVAAYLRQIEAERAMAREDQKADRQNRLPEVRLDYLDVAANLFEAGENQKGLDMLESARAIRMGIEVVDRRDTLLADRGLVADTSTSGALKPEFDELRFRTGALMSRAEGLQVFITKQLGMAGTNNHVKSAQKADASMSGIKLDLMSLMTTVNDVTDFDDDSRDTLDALRARLGECEKALAGIEAPLRKNLKEAAGVALERSEKLIKIADGKPERTGGDGAGGGDVRPRSGAKGIPQERLNRLGADLCALDNLAAAGDLDDTHLAAFNDIYADIKKELAFLEANKGFFNRAGKHIEIARTGLTSTACSYDTARRDALLKEIDKAEAKLDKEPAQASGIADQITYDLVFHEDGFRDARKDFAALEKLYDKIEKRLTGTYAPLLEKVIVKFAHHDPPGRGFKNLVRRRTTYKGEYHATLKAIWADADHGSQAARDDTRSQFDDLLDRIDTEIEALKTLKAQKADALDDTQNDTLSKALDDQMRSENEVKLRASREKTYKQIVHGAHVQIDSYSLRLVKFWRRLGDKERKIDKGASDAIGFHRALLDALEAERKETRTVEQWNALIVKAEKRRDQIDTFIRANSVASEDPAIDPGPEEAAEALRRCGIEIDTFGAWLDGLQARIVRERAAFARIAAGDGADKAGAQAVVDMLDQKAGAIAAFAATFAKPFKQHDLGGIADRISKAQKGDLMSLREEAVSVLRRLREYLTGSTLGKLYAANPVDQGAAAMPVKLQLIRAEAMLNTRIKPA